VSQWLLFLLTAFSWFCRAFGLSLGLGFFHGFLSFRGLLGTSFGTLFLLLVENFFAAE